MTPFNPSIAISPRDFRFFFHGTSIYPGSVIWWEIAFVKEPEDWPFWYVNP